MLIFRGENPLLQFPAEPVSMAALRVLRQARPGVNDERIYRSTSGFTWHEIIARSGSEYRQQVDNLQTPVQSREIRTFNSRMPLSEINQLTPSYSRARDTIIHVSGVSGSLNGLALARWEGGIENAEVGMIWRCSYSWLEIDRLLTAWVEAGKPETIGADLLLIRHNHLNPEPLPPEIVPSRGVNSGLRYAEIIRGMPNYQVDNWGVGASGGGRIAPEIKPEPARSVGRRAIRSN